MSRWDVLVSGAGPAGSATAALAAAAGLRVLLVERRPFPRNKVCGEFVSAEGRQVLGRLGVLDDLLATGAPSIGECRLTARSGAPLDAALPTFKGAGRDALGISRERMDARLLDLAIERGAVLRQPMEVRAPVVENDRVTGAILRDTKGREETVRATVVVAADGRRSPFVRALHPELGDPTRSGPTAWFGLKTHLDGSRADIAGRVDLHLFDRGYAGLAEIEGGKLNLCLMTTAGSLRAAGKDRDTLVTQRIDRNPAFRRTIGEYRRVGPWHAIGPLSFGVRRPYAAGMLFAGDAAGTIDPFSGEGMSHALLAGELIQPTLLRAVERDGLGDELGRAYADAWRARFAPVTGRVRRLGRLLERPALAGPLLRAVALGLPALGPRLVAWTRTGVREAR